MTTQEQTISLEQLDAVFDEAILNFNLIQQLANERITPSDDGYLNLNRAYFRISTSFYHGFLHLIGKGEPFPAIVILRSFLETYVKSVYAEFIMRPQDIDIEPFISGKKEFPSFFKMASELDQFGKINQNGLEGMFMQFTKQDLAQYEKFSLFTHGRGEFVQAFMKADNVKQHPNDIYDLLCTAKGMYETFALFFFGKQEKTAEFKRLLAEIRQSPTYA